MSITLRIGIAGLGTVGCGVVDIIRQQQRMLAERTGVILELSAVSARDSVRERGVDLFGVVWEKNALDLAYRNDVDIVVELIGGADGVAYELVKTALTQGKHVVTANKALIAHHGAELAELAEKHQVQLCFEAAVAGAIPIVKLIKQGLAANYFSKITGILNGTCNYILSIMERDGRTFADVLAEAQALGYAEADPSFDIDGVDAAHKITILCALAYGITPAFGLLYCEGIRDITATDMQAADEMGYVIRLIGVSEKTQQGISLRVHPALLPKSHVMAGVKGVHNAINISGSACGDVFIKGAGAGRAATASSVVADIMDIARGDRSPALLQSFASLEQAEIIPIKNLTGCYYIRLRVRDTTGVLAAIAGVFAEHDISVATLIQHHGDVKDEGEVTITITTHKVQERQIHRALSKIDALEQICDTPRMIRIEETV